MDVKELRNCILQFMKEQLQKLDGGEGENIKCIHLFITAPETERHLYESALYMHNPERFKKDEVQKIIDDYAITLSPKWEMEIKFIDTLPPGATKSDEADAGLIFSSNRQVTVNTAIKAALRVVFGTAEENYYAFTPETNRINIGREREAQTADGFFRLNNIAFPGTAHEKNKYISREHAHIEWDKERSAFFLFADEGGVPPRNKIKVQQPGGRVIKLQTTQIGHLLQSGDQIVLGESALLEFIYPAE
ncbi:MAG: hypothetical protein JWN76_2320 [Chitinophagaceae bacterium]|nr:hypothetical protein [Chitinophagaceae bacterium]